MLTATYALVAISAEQQNIRRVLKKLEESVDDNFLDRDSVERDTLEAMLEKLAVVDQYFHARVVVRSVIPTIRNATTAKEDLLGELDTWSRHAKSIIQHLRGYGKTITTSMIPRAEELYLSMEQFCQTLVKRLDQEEAELFPLAQQVLTPDEWFKVATHCLLSEKETQGRKHLQRLSESDLLRNPTRAGIERRIKQRYTPVLDMGDSQTMWP